MKKVGFGTDGWRGIIADDFTVENLGLVVQAIMSYISSVDGGSDAMGPVVIGYDTRFMSGYFARVATGVACANGFKAVVSPGPVTSPMLSHAVTGRKARGGIMITASHNPYSYNGVKFKAPYGGSAHPDITSRIERLVGNGPVLSMGYTEALAGGLAVEADYYPPYEKAVLGMVDLPLIRKASPRAVFDCMHGSASNHVGRLWSAAGLGLEVIGDEPDPYFGGLTPEPLERNLGRLMAEVVAGGYDVGFAADGDGDRLGVVGPDGSFVGAHEVLALLLLHLCRNRGLAGTVVKTVSTGSLVDRVAARLGLPLIETPVGFKNICRAMMEQDVLIGGEENGGVGIRGPVPERDGFLAALLVLEAMAYKGSGLGELLKAMREEYGALHYERHDLRVEQKRAAAVMAGSDAEIAAAFGSFGINRIGRLDGIKAVFDDGSWILFRPSGTEPVLRLYCEADDPVRVGLLISRAKEVFLG